MNVAFLFNSDHPTLGGYYGPPVMDRILGAGVLQKTKRNMRVSVGDILTYGTVASSETPTIAHLMELCRAVYRPIIFDRLILDRLEATHGRATVYCWLFQNMTAPLAQDLHEKLTPDDIYLGAMDVEFSKSLHLGYFRNSLVEAYRLNGLHCSVFCDMGQDEDHDIVIREGFEEHGFSVGYEDMGARRTIFDNYDTLAHFKRVASFKTVFSQLVGLDTDQISDLTHNLEELHPKLFDAFASAARALERSETEEDYAQAALSGRRLLERTADYLFPPRDETWNGRKVGQPQYRNRLWAYIEKTIGESGCRGTGNLEHLGKDANRLVELFNAGVHADLTREKVEMAFCDLVMWLSQVVELNPQAARKPYLAYEDELMGFFDGIAERRVSVGSYEAQQGANEGGIEKPPLPLA